MRLRELGHYRQWLIGIGTVGLVLALGSCSSTYYLWQATKGQMAIMNRARPLDQVIADERTPGRIKRLLQEIPKIKAYGERYELQETTNYQDYVHWDDQAISWVVTACEPLAFESKKWSFPIVGSFNYLGWFSREDALEYSRELKAEGWDVHVRGASAYSTLGWFKDPVLSTMISKGDQAMGDLVNVILHESVHATLYIDGQSLFNESIASFIGDELTLSYLQENFGESSAEYRSYKAAEKKGLEYRRALHETYEELKKVYESNETDETKRQKKSEIISELKKRLNSKREFNNAHLIQFRTYRAGIAEFEVVFEQCGRDWKKFWAILRDLKEESFPKEQAKSFASTLEPLAQTYCL